MNRLPAILVAVLLLCACSGRAMVYTVPDATWPAISNYVVSLSLNAGDQVNIPAGVYTWYNTLPNIYGWQLVGAGTNLTTIVDETPTNGNGISLITMTSHPTGLSRITQIEFIDGVTNNHLWVQVQSNSAAATRGVINIYGTYPFRIDHCVFTNLTGKPIINNNAWNGLVDHCAFPMYAGANAIECFGGQASDGYLGDYSWATPYAYGGSNAFYVEDCYFNSAFHFTACDVFEGGRAVFRNNYFGYCTVYTHGSESGNRNRSARIVEVYSNIFDFGHGVYTDAQAAIVSRGGTALFFNNLVTNCFNLSQLQDYRSEDNSPYFSPWYGATGLNTYDSNSPALLSGTATATSTNLVVSGASWSINQYLGCTVYNSNNTLCGVVCTNTSNTMSFWILAPGDIYQQHFTNGDPFVVHLVYPALDQIGRGQGGLMSNSVPTAQWYNEDLEPVYSWGNTVDTINYGVYTGGCLFYMAPNILSGRDYTNAPMPGYVAYTYPDPLIQATSSSGPAYTIQFQFNPTH